MNATARDVDLRLSGFRYRYRVLPCAGSPVAPVAPIVFLSSPWQPMEAWEAYATRLNRLAPVVLVELPGIGGADVLPASYGLHFLVDALAQVIAVERLSEINLFAYSYSTPIAVRYCQLHARNVRRVLLVGAARRLGPVQKAALAEGVSCLRKGALADFVDCSLRALMCQNERTPIARRRAIAQRLPALWSRDLCAGDLAKHEQNSLRLLHAPQLAIEPPVVDVPALIFTGEHDPYTPPDEGRTVARAFIGSAFTTIRRADHFCLLERPGTALRLISQFFQGLPVEDVPDCTPIEPYPPPTQPRPLSADAVELM